MPGNDTFKIEGRVIEAGDGRWCRVELSNGHQLRAYLRVRRPTAGVRFERGDRLVVEVSPFDMSKARIVTDND